MDLPVALPTAAVVKPRKSGRTLDPLLPATWGTLDLQPHQAARGTQEMNRTEEGSEVLESHETQEASEAVERRKQA